MKGRAIHILIWCTILFLGSCTDYKLFDFEQKVNDPNLIKFGVTSSVTLEAASRSLSSDNDTTDLLQPLILQSPELDFPLYLHTYVADEHERNNNAPVATRSAQVENITDFVALNRADGFHVTACDEAASPFIPQFAVAKPSSSSANENVWNTTPSYYWPVDDRMLCFSAYAPMSAKNLLENLTFADHTISYDYTTPKGDKGNDAEVQPDIMFAMSDCNKPTSIDGKVPLNFRHALSAIKFAVRDVVSGTIKKITISGVAGEAHCVYTKLSDPATDSFTWSEHGEANCSYTQTFDFRTTENYADQTDETQDVVLNDEMPSKTFFLIPQNITSDAKIEVVFRRDSDGQEKTMTGYILDNNVTKWEPGKEYIYTISTSSSNWIYYFDVIGSVQEKNDTLPRLGKFNDNGDSIVLNETVTKGSYYKVLSYRVRANNQKTTELVPWEITYISKGKFSMPAGIPNEHRPPLYDIDPDEWIPEITMSGEGSTDYVTYYPIFCAQKVATNHIGDLEMQKRDEFGTETAPYDLSMIYGTMNTANCYVVNAPGYYKFPLVYGNAITNGATNSTSYKFTKPTYYNSSIIPSLTTFTDYKGSNITGPKISGASDAVLVWQDAYNLVSDVKLNPNDGTYGTVSFKVNKENLQQGNIVIAIRDASGTIMWSWHIWITEHWTNAGSLQLTGDLNIKAYNTGYITNNKFSAAPQNLGWCDPKTVWYLQCSGDAVFKQKITGKEDTLDILQRQDSIHYWIGNNTYYQFGRKDPMVGFKNSGSIVKYNFGNYLYELSPQPKSIADGIKNPNVLYVGSTEHNDTGVGYDWLSTHYLNLWNNTKKDHPLNGNTPTSTNTIAYHYSGVKTVYDPCPVGYIVPPVGFFKQITNGLNNDTGAKKTDGTLNFNGVVETIPTGEGGTFYRYRVNTMDNGVYWYLTGTGHRWYATTVMTPGGNFNPSLAYLWSNQPLFTSEGKEAYGLALGITGADYVSNFAFIGRRAMARPVRPIKIFE